MLWLANQYIETPKLPSRLGYEVAGVVEAVATRHGVQAGDRVIPPGVFDQRLPNFGKPPSSPTGLTPTRSVLPRRGASFAFAYFTGYFGLYELAASSRARPCW